MHVSINWSHINFCNYCCQIVSPPYSLLMNDLGLQRIYEGAVAHFFKGEDGRASFGGGNKRWVSYAVSRILFEVTAVENGFSWHVAK